MRRVARVLAILFVSCSAPKADECTALGGNNPPPGAMLCAAGQQCVYVRSNVFRTCQASCEDAGCPPGSSCGCGASCPSCENCIRVCQ